MRKEYDIILLIINKPIKYLQIILFKKNIYNRVIKNYYTYQVYMVL